MLGPSLGQGALALRRLGHPESAAVLSLVEALGADRVAVLRERGAAMDPRTAVEYLRTEASPALTDE